MTRPAGAFVLRSRATEIEAAGWATVKRFANWWKGPIGARGCPQGQISQPVGVMAARGVPAHPRLPATVIADFHLRPMATNEQEPLKRPAALRGDAGKAVV